MRTVFVSLLVVALCGASLQQPKPFKADRSYTYRFDTQVSSSLLGSTPSELQQQAATRVRADVQLSFTSDRHAKLQLQHVQFGELNEQLAQSQRVQPFERFQRRPITDELRETLEMPLSFEYVEGAVHHVNFHEKDSAWSKNIKRSVLNLLQLNLKRNDVPGLTMQKSQDFADEKNPAVFSIPEITLEGECEVTYTVQQNKNKQSEEEQREFNVTKSINFARCQRTADVTYGYRAQPSQQLRCLNCIRQQQPQADAEQIEQIKAGQCQQECRPNAINHEQDIERSTVGRYELFGKSDKFAVKRSQMFSQYLVKGANPAAQNTIAQIISIAELTLKEEHESAKQIASFKQSSQDESLMYSAEWDLMEKRFYMYGDEEYQTNSPFSKVEKKEQRAAQAMRSILQAWTDKEQGYELDSALQFNELVTVLRQASVKELESIEKSLRQAARENGDKAEEQCRIIYEDAMAVAATRNTLYILSQKIIKNEMNVEQSLKVLKIFLMNQHSPSERQVDLFEKIAKSEVAQRSAPLKQTAWLSFGAAVGEICQDKPSETQKQMFRVEELCPSGKKELYKKTLFEQLKKAESTYEKMLALKTIGNAALDLTVPELQKIIDNQNEQTLVRMEAIDALRRLRTTVPQKIQQILLPIFQNQREQPEIRMTAFSMIMYTHPDKSVLDQLVFSTLNERSQNVKSFVITAMESLSQSPNNAEQEIAQHMKAALKVVQIDRDQFRASRFNRIPVYVSGPECNEEQNLFMGLAAIVSPTNMIPIKLAASLSSAFEGQSAEEKLKISFTQKDLEQWYEKLAEVAQQYTESSEENDDKKSRPYAKTLGSMYSSMGIKSRRTGSYYNSNEESEEDESTSVSKRSESDKPFGMIVIRTNEVDRWIVPVEEQSLPSMLKKLMNGEKPSLSGMGDLVNALAEGKHFRHHLAITLLEKKTKLPTSAGMPLAIWSQFSGVGSVEGKVKAQLSGSTKKIELQLRGSGIGTQMYKTELWTPVLASGIETVRTIELNGPLDIQIDADKEGLKLTIRPPQQHQHRIFGVHTLPLTYTRHFDSKTRTYREPRVLTIQNPALQATQREYHAKQQQGQVIRVEGHVHYVKNAEQFIHALFTTENNVHVYYKPTENAPKEIIVRASGRSFEKLSKHSRPELDSFYSKRFDSEEDFEQMELEKDEQRRSKLDSFVKSYSPKNAYKHQLTVSAEARCAQKSHKVQAEIQGECDSRMKHCRVQVEAKRSPMSWESSEWKLNAKLQTVAPEIVRDDEEHSQKQNRALAQLDATWGSETEQKMNVRIQAEPTKKTYWQSESEEQESTRSKSNKWSRFLNKLDMVAEYKLQPQQKQYVQRLFEVVKAKYFWQLNSEHHQGEEGVIRAWMLIDPVSRQFANISVKTPTEKIRLDSVQLPRMASSFRLDRRPTNIHSVRHVLQRFSPISSNAECTVDSRRVATFDGVDYKAPLSSCWTVLAKDCSREEPRFAVLIKKTSEEQKLKIITPEQIVEIESDKEDNNKLRVKINGQRVKDEEELSENGIELTKGQVYVNVRSINVRFDGEKAEIKVSAIYKNTQCGLCGHYSEEEENVFRMNNNQRSSSLKEFHKSYTLKNEECSEQEYNKFYEQESNEFRVKKSDKSRRYQNEESDESSSASSEQTQSSKSDEESNSFEKEQKVKPVERTAIREHQHKICFSVEPVKRCPSGSSVDEEADQKETKMRFVCINRSSVEARRLQRQVRQGRLADVSHFTPTYTESVKQPTQCVAF